jgi:plasmid stabilization system protein ParE
MGIMDKLKYLPLALRMLPVKNYLVFYVVTEHEVEIHRIIYAKMNLEKL